MSKCELNKTTFLRLNKPADFRLVDEILRELSSRENKESDISSKETCTDFNHGQSPQKGNEILEESEKHTNASVDDEEPQKPEDEEALTKPTMCNEAKIKFACTIQYETPAELAAVLGQVWVSTADSISGVGSEANIAPPTLENEGCRDRVPIDEDESVETEQMRRLIEIAEWRRSLLRDI